MYNKNNSKQKGGGMLNIITPTRRQINGPQDDHILNDIKRLTSDSSKIQTTINRNKYFISKPDDYYRIKSPDDKSEELTEDVNYKYELNYKIPIYIRSILYETISITNDDYIKIKSLQFTDRYNLEVYVESTPKQNTMVSVICINNGDPITKTFMLIGCNNTQMEHGDCRQLFPKDAHYPYTFML